MTFNQVKRVVLTVIAGISLSIFASCSNSVEAKKAAEAPAAKPAEAVAAPVAEKTPEQQAVINEVKEIFICQRINISIKDAEDSGALCPDGKKILDLVDTMMAGGMAKEDILFLVGNHRLQGQSITQKNGSEVCKSEGGVNLDFFIMSYCPYGVKYVDQVLHPMIDDFGKDLKWTPRYILSPAGDGKYSSMHGQKEVDEDLRQICIRDKWGMDKWLSYMDCFSPEIFYKQSSGNAKDWKFCAEQAGISADELQQCYDTDSYQMAQKDVELAQKYRASGSPTAVYNCSTNIVGAIPYPNVKPYICKMADGSEACVN